MVRIAVNKWGNASGLRLPKAFCKQLGINIGDEVNVEISGNRLIIEPIQPQQTIDVLLAHWNGTRDVSPEIDWGSDAGREMPEEWL